MPTFEYGSIKIEVDEAGFIADSNQWSREIACAFAAADGIPEMSEAHWKIADYLRDYYLKFNIAPPVRKLCKETGFSLKEIYELFPAGPANGACKIAGLTKPTGCV